MSESNTPKRVTRVLRLWHIIRVDVGGCIQYCYVGIEYSQESHKRDCEIYLLAFAKYLSEGEGIPVQYLDSKLHRIRYGPLLWEYAAKKMEEGAVSENEAPPRMIGPPQESIIVNLLGSISFLS
ncbi:hypothetical protein KY284_035736 [Solanum tuberosum]|nr:hypothetical protein KY284_035736 [Solanum tuberosum]